ncbi:MAG: indole-3-glycerol-phosphate synthase [Candidatus Lambdaproteobacteria bacterium]|nr:indole-3-glycerol-phosphate synthase [Candidatus Lambdaproteobacteria bacterium]
MADILAQIVAKKREEVAARKRELEPARVAEQARARAPALDFEGALRGVRPRGAGGNGRLPEARIIAEIKRRSPSQGEFPWHGDAPRQARAYERGGARAISVVTDGPFFGGSPELLQQVKAATALPVLQKEFVLEPYQVRFARALGADAVLLIAAILPGALLGELIACAREEGLHSLVEVVNAAELARAQAGGARVIGVNNRDLRTFRTDPARTLALLPQVGDERVLVTESGIRSRADIERMLRAGVDAFLIGEALMTSADPALHLLTLRGQLAVQAAPAGGGP